ncbi:hypothetical protein D9M68_363810 [compost metagenome]
MFEIGFGDRGPHRHARIEAREGILEDHLHGAAHVAQAPAVHRQHVLSVKHHRAAFRLDQPHNGTAGRRLAAAGFADERQRLARLQAEGDVFDRVHAALELAQQTGVNVEALAEVLHLKDRLAVGLNRVGRFSHGTRKTGCRIDDRKAHRLGLALHRPEHRHRRKKRAGIGMFRPEEDVFRATGFDRVTAEHHHGAIGDLGDDAHVVGDEQHRGAFLLLQHFDQVEDLALDGDVERRRRLVGDQQLRTACKRHGDHHALAHAAGEAVRVLVEA